MVKSLCTFERSDYIERVTNNIIKVILRANSDTNEGN